MDLVVTATAYGGRKTKSPFSFMKISGGVNKSNISPLACSFASGHSEFKATACSNINRIIRFIQEGAFTSILLLDGKRKYKTYPND